MQAGISYTAIFSNCDNLIIVARIVSTQKANRAARFSAARFIARHIEVETRRLRSPYFAAQEKGDLDHNMGDWA